MQARILLAFWILSLAPLGATAQSEPNQPAPPSDSTQSSQVWATNLGDEPVGAGDLVYITVTGSPEFTRSYRVSNDGDISMPLACQNRAPPVTYASKGALTNILSVTPAPRGSRA